MVAKAKRFNDDANKRDPYRGFNYRVSANGEAMGACRKVSALTATIEVVKFRAGDDENTDDRKMPGRCDWTEITLEGGITQNKAFAKWAGMLMTYKPEERKNQDEFRRDLTITLLDLDGRTTVKEWTVHKCWPSSCTFMSDLDASANDVLIETLVLQHQGVTEET